MRLQKLDLLPCKLGLVVLLDDLTELLIDTLASEFINFLRIDSTEKTVFNRGEQGGNFPYLANFDIQDQTFIGDQAVFDATHDHEFLLIFLNKTERMSLHGTGENGDHGH